MPNRQPIGTYTPSCGGRRRDFRKVSVIPYTSDLPEEGESDTLYIIEPYPGTNGRIRVYGWAGNDFYKLAM